MNYGNIKICDIADGPGVRVSLFVSGCRNHCPGCFNKETWSFDYGKSFTTETIDTIMKELEKPYVCGLTVLGGDPFEPENIVQVERLCKIAKMLHPEKTVWVYTGYHFEDFMGITTMQYIDVLVDGPFIESKKNLNLRFRGSENQRLIDVQKSLKAGHAVEWIDMDYENRMR